MAGWTQVELFRSPASSPGFFNSGRTRACLNAAGKQPEISDLLNKSVMNGDKTPRISFTSHVGAGSRSQVLFTAALINANCSSPARLRRRSVHARSLDRARCLGTLFPRSFVTQLSHQHLQTILENLSLQQLF